MALETKEYYIEANSFAAPFFSDRSFAYISAVSPEHALEQFAIDYKHPARLYAAAAYTNSDARNKGEKPLARWLCNKAQFMEGKLGTICWASDHDGEINGEAVHLDDPYSGSVV